MKPSDHQNGRDSFTTDTVTCLFSNIGFTTETDQFHYEHRQSHQRHRVLDFPVSFLARGFAIWDCPIVLAPTAQAAPGVLPVYYHRADGPTGSRQEASAGPGEARTTVALTKALDTPSPTMTPPCGPKILILGCPQAAPYKTRAFDSQTKRSVPKLGGRHTQHPGDGMGFGLQNSMNCEGS
jgi:hypothetical protein